VTVAARLAVAGAAAIRWNRDLRNHASLQRLVLPPAPSPAPKVTPLSTEVRIDLTTTPSGATVVVAGEEHGITPTTLRLPRGEQAIVIEFRRNGFAKLEETIRPNVDQRLQLSLVRVHGSHSHHGAGDPAARPATHAPEPTAGFHRFD